jgi:hypothetical protein
MAFARPAQLTPALILYEMADSPRLDSRYQLSFHGVPSHMVSVPMALDLYKRVLLFFVEAFDSSKFLRSDHFSCLMTRPRTVWKNRYLLHDRPREREGPIVSDCTPATNCIARRSGSLSRKVIGHQISSKRKLIGDRHFQS